MMMALPFLGGMLAPIDTVSFVQMLIERLPLVTESRLEYVNRQSLIQNTAPSYIDSPQTVPE